MVGVSWRVLDAGPGIAQLDDLLADLGPGRPLGDPGERQREDRGDGAPAAGRAYRLRLTSPTRSGASSTVALGKVTVPR